jgi:ABC-type sulfate transport system substrate-binding protein
MNCKWAIPAAIAVILLPAITGCLGGPDEETDAIMLYGFSVKGEVFDSKIIPAFKTMYKKETGKEIEFQTVYAGSGEITTQVINGAMAEVMILSTEWDALSVKKAGLCTTDWNTFKYNGTVSTSPWVILVRNGNPKNINDYRDLGKDGVEIVHADPITSGGACWSIFSIYGSELRRTSAVEGKENVTAAKALLKEVTENVISWQSSARKALAQFTLGFGDALITYENDALLAKSQGQDFEIIYPVSTISSEHKAILVDKNIEDGEKEACQKFIDFVFTDEVQQYMVEYNFRSEKQDLNTGLVPIEDPWRVSYLGGWEKAHAEIIEDIFADYKGG